jgi:4-amino-4-deoxychorismate lyase
MAGNGLGDGVLAVAGPGGEVRVLDPANPVVRADDSAVLTGEAVFETLRTHAGRAFLLAEHLDRMRRSAARMRLPLPAEELLRRLADAALASFRWRDGRLRLVCTRGPAGGTGLTFALVTPVPPALARARQDGVGAVTLSLGVTADGRHSAPWLLAGVKHTSYAVPMAALRVAAEAGADEAVWVSVDGAVLEGATSTVIVVRSGRAFTPPAAELGLLPGTTLAALGALAPGAGLPAGIGTRRIAVADLRDADEAMLVSSVRGVAPLVRVDAAAIGDGRVGPVTAGLRDAFEEAVRRGSR